MKRVLLLLSIIISININAQDTCFVDTLQIDQVEQPVKRDWKRLSINTANFVGAGILTLGVLELLPEDVTAWNKAEMKDKSLWHRYKDNVTSGPVIDKDNPVFNYLLHPYGGAVYFMSARSNGFTFVESMLYSTFVSTVLWEYGIEAFNEIPSVQDLIITPLMGSLIGEGFHKLKLNILKNDGKLFGSRFIGGFVLWLIDPFNSLMDLFHKPKHKNIDFNVGLNASNLTPSISMQLKI